MAQIVCRDVSLGYDGKTVVEKLNFTVNKGDYLCSVGENGSGKSTLIKSLLRLKNPLKGFIKTGDGLCQNEIGYLPQQTEAQRDFPAAVKEVVISGFLNRCGLRPFYTKAEKEEAMQNMKKLSVSHLAERCYRELSGGQQQRVLLARALCATGKMLLLDEPVAGLDPKVTAEMYELIKKINRDEKITVIMVSHDMSAALKYSSHILHIGKSSQIFFGTTDKYLKSTAGSAYFSLYGKERI